MNSLRGLLISAVAVIRSGQLWRPLRLIRLDVVRPEIVEEAKRVERIEDREESREYGEQIREKRAKENNNMQMMKKILQSGIWQILRSDSK